MIEVTRSNGMHMARVAGALTIYTAADSKASFASALEGATDIELDMTEVEEMDTAGYQLVLALKREADALGVSFSVAGHSRAVHDILEFYQALEALNVRID